MDKETAFRKDIYGLTAYENTEKISEKVIEYLKNGGDPDVLVDTPIEYNKYTALYEFIFRGSKNKYIFIIKLLLQYGASSNHRDFRGDNSLHKLIKDKTTINFEALNLLLDSGADINMKNDEGYTPLTCIAKDIYSNAYGNNIEETIKYLVSKGANINEVDNKGRTMLINAMKNGCDFLVDILIANGADPDIIDKKGHKAMYYTIKRNVVQFL